MAICGQINTYILTMAFVEYYQRPWIEDHSYHLYEWSFILPNGDLHENIFGGLIEWIP